MWTRFGKPVAGVGCAVSKYVQAVRRCAAMAGAYSSIRSSVSVVTQRLLSSTSLPWRWPRSARSWDFQASGKAKVSIPYRGLSFINC